MPLLDILGIDGLDQSFTVGLVFLNVETEEDYYWAISHLQSLFKQGIWPSVWCRHTNNMYQQNSRHGKGGDSIYIIRTLTFCPEYHWAHEMKCTISSPSHTESDGMKL
jgi:hypothetical protein